MKNIIILLVFFAAQNSMQATEEAQSKPSFYTKLKYEVSLGYTQMSSDAWWTKLEPFNITLGALPLKNKGHLEEIAGLGVTRVLSLVEDFELEEGYLNTPVKAKDWAAYSIEIKQIPAADYLPLTRSDLASGIAYLSEWLQEGHTVYVHCKAGRGRSASVVIAYLMQHELLSFDEAYALVKELRPQIHLNDQQRQAILDYFAEDAGDAKEPIVTKSWAASMQETMYGYFQNKAEISEERLAELLDNMLYYVIEGVTYWPGEKVPASLSGWIPTVNIESTLSRRNRYLREYEGDQDAATEAAISRNHNLIRRFKTAATNVIPFLGGPTSYSISLWHQLREIALIAAIHGHDLRDPEVKMKILSAVVGGNLLKIPAASVDLLARNIVKKIAVQAGISSIPGAAIPTHLIFNFFTDNAAKVSMHAKAIFAGENSIPILQSEYSHLE